VVLPQDLVQPKAAVEVALAVLDLQEIQRIWGMVDLESKYHLHLEIHQQQLEDLDQTVKDFGSPVVEVVVVGHLLVLVVEVDLEGLMLVEEMVVMLIYKAMDLLDSLTPAVAEVEELKIQEQETVVLVAPVSSSLLTQPKA